MRLEESRLGQLVQSRKEYEGEVSPFYDEVLHEVADRVQAAGSLSKADVGALLSWKRLRADTRWVRALMAQPDEQVRCHTAAAVSAVNDPDLSVVEAAKRGRADLSKLPGFASGDALASAVLLAAAPHRMAVYDRRAHAGLSSLGIPLASSRGRYARYMALVDELRHAAHAAGLAWTARDVDKALYMLGEPNRPKQGRHTWAGPR